MSILITRRMRGFCLGDSLLPGFGGSISPLAPLGQAISAQFGVLPPMPPISAPFVPNLYKLPFWGSVDGSAGRSCQTIASSAGAFQTFCQGFNKPFDFAVVELGINDADGIRTASFTLAQALAAQLVILQGLTTNLGIPANQILWLGPWNHDTGDDLTQIASLDSISSNPTTGGFQGQCVANGSTYAQMSASVTQFTQAFVSANFTTGDGTHPNTAGANLYSAFIMAGGYIRFA